MPQVVLVLSRKIKKIKQQFSDFFSFSRSNAQISYSI